MIRWTGLAPWEFEFPFPGSLTSTFVGRFGVNSMARLFALEEKDLDTILGADPNPLSHTLSLSRAHTLSLSHTKREREREREEKDTRNPRVCVCACVCACVRLCVYVCERENE